MRLSVCLSAWLLAAGLLLTAHSPARAEVLVGVAGPMSGSFADVGRDIEAGALLAIAAVNAAGGLDGETLKAVVVDDRCDPTTGAAVANQLIGKGVRFVVGHACTAAGLPAARVYAEHGVLFVATAATNPRLTDEGVGPGVLRLAIRSDRQGRAISDYLARHLPKARVAFVHDGGVYGQGLVEAAAAGFGAAGGTVALSEAFTPGEKSQNNLVGHIQDAAVSAVVLGALQADAAVIASAMRARGLKAAIVGDEALGLEEFRALAGPAAEGVVFMLPDVDRSQPQAVDLLMALEERGLMPTDALMTSYAAVEVAAAGLAGGADAATAGGRLRAGARATVIGPVGFDARGDWAEGRYAAHVWHGDRFERAD